MAARSKHADLFTFLMAVKLVKLEPDADLNRYIELLRVVAKGELTLSEPADIIAKLDIPEDIELVQRNLKSSQAHNQRLAKTILKQLDEA